MYPFINSSEAPTMSYKSGSVLRIFFFKLAGFTHPVLCYSIFCTSSTIIKLCSPPFLQQQLLCAKRQTPYPGLMAHLNALPMITKTSCINCPGLHISIIISYKLCMTTITTLVYLNPSQVSKHNSPNNSQKRLV